MIDIFGQRRIMDFPRLVWTWNKAKVQVNHYCDQGIDAFDITVQKGLGLTRKFF